MKLPTTYEKLPPRGRWDIVVSSHGHRIIREGREVDELKWIAVATRGLEMQVYPREPRTFPTRSEALDALHLAIDAVESLA
jgi:hypothetical protein